MLIEYRSVRLLTRVFEALAGPHMAETLWNRLGEAMRLDPAHLAQQDDVSKCRALFRCSVRNVEIEIHSYCNRTCWFCPNSFVDRRTTRHYLPTSIYSQILKDLASIRYRGFITFSRYNEPFGDAIIFDRISEARNLVPTAKLRAYSNGDFLTGSLIRDVHRLGLNELQIGIYLKNEQEWNEAVADRMLKRAIGRFDLHPGRQRRIPGERIAYVERRSGLRITVFCPNYSRFGIDRGGAVHGTPVHNGPRKAPCFYTLTDFFVDYNGSIMPCCHLRSDVKYHAETKLGQIDANEGSIFRNYGGLRSANWRKALSQSKPKSGPCSSCTARMWSEGKLGDSLLSAIRRWRIGNTNDDKFEEKCAVPLTFALPILGKARQPEEQTTRKREGEPATTLANEVAEV